MRKVVFGVANSLDNYIARADHGVDWLLWSDEVAQFVREFWQTVDTVVMGRKTYEVALASGQGAYAGANNYVVSRTLQPGDPNVRIEHDGVALIRRLKNEPGKDICIMGGGELARTLFEAGLIDEVGVNIHPILLGRGIPLFGELSKEVKLELFENRQFATGCVMLRYRVV